MFLETRMKKDNTGVYILPKNGEKGTKDKKTKMGVSEFIQNCFITLSQ